MGRPCRESASRVTSEQTELEGRCICFLLFSEQTVAKLCPSSSHRPPPRPTPVALSICQPESLGSVGGALMRTASPFPIGLALLMGGMTQGLLWAWERWEKQSLQT